MSDHIYGFRVCGGETEDGESCCPVFRTLLDPGICWQMACIERSLAVSAMDMAMRYCASPDHREQSAAALCMYLAETYWREARLWEMEVDDARRWVP